MVKDGPPAEKEAEPPASCDFWTVLARERPRLVRLLSSRGETIADAEDYVQETFVRIARLPTVDLARLPSLATVIAKRVACDAHRGQRTRARLGAVLSAGFFPESPEELATLRGEAEHLLAAAARLPNREREVVSLCVAGNSLREAASYLGVSYKCVERALSRARMKLRLVAL